MFEIAYITGLSVAAFLAPIIGIMLVLLAMQVTKKRQTGFMHLVPYAIILVAMADTFFSGRSLDNISLLLSNSVSRPSVNVWLVRVASFLILMVSFERIFTIAMLNGHILGRRPGLTLSFIAFWVGSVGMPMFFSANPYFSHDYLYPLIIGIAVLSLSEEESKKFILAVRNSLIFVIVAGLLMIKIHPEMVIESNYSQGFIAGLPRFSGLLAYAVIQGVVALIMLLILYAHPLKNKTVNKIVWVIGLIVLFIAQSKTSWISAIVCFGVLFSMKYLYLDESQVNPNRKFKVVSTIMSGVLIISLFAGLTLVFGNVGARVDKFLFSNEGQQLASLTGRDIIWQYALGEWEKNPILGYGTQFLDLNQRILIGMPNATHAHNQFIDTLARSGMLGLIPLVAYLFVLIFILVKMQRRSRPLPLVIFLVLLFNSISEVPFSLFGYGIEPLFQFLLFAIILTSQSSDRKISPQPSQTGAHSIL